MTTRSKNGTTPTAVEVPQKFTLSVDGLQLSIIHSFCVQGSGYQTAEMQMAAARLRTQVESLLPTEPESDPTRVSLERYVDAQLREVRRAAELAATMPAAEVPLREYVEALLNEHKHAVEVASEEREKSAKALRDELERTIQEGDRNLRDHIENQIEQVKAALVSAELLEIQRFESLRREMQLITEAAQEAINKLADAYEKRFEAVNEFRAQLADQTGTFMPREVADAQFAELRRAITELTAKVGKLL